MLKEDEEFKRKANIPRSCVSWQDVGNEMHHKHCWRKLWIRIVSMYTLTVQIKVNESEKLCQILLNTVDLVLVWDLKFTQLCWEKSKNEFCYCTNILYTLHNHSGWLKNVLECSILVCLYLTNLACLFVTSCLPINNITNTSSKWNFGVWYMLGLGMLWVNEILL